MKTIDKSTNNPETLSEKSFSIIGNCTLRDCFDIAKDNIECHFDYKFNSFFQYISLFSMYSQKPKEIDITDEDLGYGTPWQKKCYKADINRKVIDLTNFNSDYILVDIAHNRLNLLKSKKDKNVLISSSILSDKNREETEEYVGSGFELIKPYDLDKKYISYCLKKFANDLLQKVNQSKIIVCELYSSEDYINFDGTIKNFIDEHEIPIKNNFLKKNFREFIKYLPQAHVIEMPKYAIGNYKHKWGPHPLHFCDEYYSYLLECIDLILKMENKDNEKRLLKKIKSKYETLFLNKRKNLMLNFEENNNKIDNRKNKTFSILGSCVARDLFEIGDNSNLNYFYKVNSFWSLSPLSVFGKRIKNLNSVKIDDFVFGSNWQKKCILVDLERKYIEQTDFSSDFILVDLAFSKIDLAQFSKHKDCYFTANLPFINNVSILKKVLHDDVNFVHVVDLPEDFFLEKIRTFAQKLKTKTLGENIILLDLECAIDYFDKNGVISKFDNVDLIKKENELLKKAFNCFLEELPNCHIIKMPKGVLGYELHKWGKLNLHYCNEFYDYLLKCIDIICSNYSRKKEIKEIEFCKNICEQIFKDRRRIVELKEIIHKQVKIKQDLNGEVSTLKKDLHELNIKLEKIDLENKFIKSTKFYKLGKFFKLFPVNKTNN